MIVQPKTYREGYLRRAGCAVADRPTDIPGPWAPSLAGRWWDAAEAWHRLGERYEQGVELAQFGHDKARAAGLAILESLGARATITRVLAEPADRAVIPPETPRSSTLDWATQQTDSSRGGGQPGTARG